MRNFVRLGGFFPLFLVLIVFSIFVPAVNSDLGGISGTESIISTATWGTDQNYPAIWEDRVVWTHYYYPDPVDPGMIASDIYLLYLTSGAITKISSTMSFQEMPDIYEDLIVWQTGEDENYEIHLFNLSSGEERRLTNDQVHQIKPKIWGKWIVWQEGLDEESEWSVFLYSIDTRKVTQLGDTSSSAKSPDIWEDRVVWEDCRNGGDNSDIYSYNISTGIETQITTAPSFQGFPSIWKDRIVWMDERSTPPQIYVYDLIFGTERSFTSGAIPLSSPQISGDYVVYVNNTAISCIDLMEMTDSPLSTNGAGGTRLNPAIWGNRVTWADTRNGDSDIFLFTLGVSMPPLNADFSTNTTQGTAPLTVAFTDATSGQAQGWDWDFGDGAGSSEQHPVHTYNSKGSYSVTLTVHNPYQRDALRKNELISVKSEPVPKFSQNTTGGPAPLAVQFTDESSGLPTSWNWNFGDGQESYDQNPVHVYALPGVYDVMLIASNIFGNVTLTKSGLITVVNGTYYSCILPAEGIEIEDSNHLILNTTLAGTCSFDPEKGAKKVICDPGGQSGLDQIEFLALNGTEFVTTGTDIIEGDLQGVVIRSSTMGPLNLSQETGEQFLFNFTISQDLYSPGHVFPLVAWEGCIPDDFQKVWDVTINNDNSYLNHIAFSVQFDVDSQSEGPATLVFGLSSDWVQEYGWSDNRPLEIATNVSDAMIFIDGTYLGVSPIVITNLTPGEHQLRTSKAGYRDNLSTLIIGSDKRESIHVIRIGDNGSGEVLNTTFIGHDDEQNLDFFMAESPNGLSTFGLASLSKSGNLFRLFYLTIAQSVQANTGGSGGGGGSGGYIGRQAETPTTIPTPTPAPTLTSRETITPPATGVPGTTAPTTHPTSQPTQTSTVTPTDGGGWEWPPYLVLLRNLSVVFAVIFVAVAFYLRWNKREV